MRSAILTGVIVVVLALAACAQIPRGNVFVGYSYAHVPQDPSIAGSSGLNGWNGSVELKMAPLLSVVVEGSGLYGQRAEETPCIPNTNGCGPVNEDAKFYTFLVGPRIGAGAGRVHVFGHGLFGAGFLRQSGSGFSLSQNVFAAALGGGVDYRLARGVAWRVQGDDLILTESYHSLNSLRFSTGLVFRF